jgi:hypothetical protein
MMIFLASKARTLQRLRNHHHNGWSDEHPGICRMAFCDAKPSAQRLFPLPKSRQN